MTTLNTASRPSASTSAGTSGAFSGVGGRGTSTALALHPHAARSSWSDLSMYGLALPGSSRLSENVFCLGARWTCFMTAFPSVGLVVGWPHISFLRLSPPLSGVGKFSPTAACAALQRLPRRLRPRPWMVSDPTRKLRAADKAVTPRRLTEARRTSPVVTSIGSANPNLHRGAGCGRDNAALAPDRCVIVTARTVTVAAGRGAAVHDPDVP
jgi:hypothetical protein